MSKEGMVSFENAVSRLNAGNLNELWELAALLTVLEYYGSHALDLFPELHFDRPRLLCEAILASKASFLRHRQYTADDFIKIINGSGEGLADPRIQEIKNGQERESMLFDLIRFFSRQANIQIRYQDMRAGDVGRTLAMYDVLPRSGQFRDKPTAALVQRVKAKIDASLGCSIPELLLMFAKVGLWQRQLYDNLETALDLNLQRRFTQKEQRLRRLRVVLTRMFDSRHALHPLVSFTKADLLNFAGNKSRQEAFSAFQRCCCADTSTLRTLRDLTEYSAGAECWHLSPLERYPVVKMQGLPGETSRYVVPNFRFFLRSLPAILDYTLLESLDADYDQFRGAVFEAYVAMMLHDTYPDSIAVPERGYARVKAMAKKGPDVAFVEALGEPLLLFEVKARRLRADTRSEMDDDSIDHNLADVYAALRRLPTKATDLFQGIPEYSEMTDALQATSRAQSIGLCILPDAPFAINELTYYRASRGEHGLAQIDFEYCIMGIGTLEKAVAVAKQRETSLAVVLREFMDRAKDLEMHGPLAEFFGEEGAEPEMIYGETFLDRIKWDCDGKYAAT